MPAIYRGLSGILLSGYANTTEQEYAESSAFFYVRTSLFKQELRSYPKSRKMSRDNNKNTIL